MKEGMSLTGRASGSALATLEERLEEGVLGMWHQICVNTRHWRRNGKIGTQWPRFATDLVCY